MKKLILIIALCTFVYSQDSIPDSVVVNKLAKIEAEFNKNKEIIEQYQARQEYLRASYATLSELIKKEKEDVQD